MAEHGTQSGYRQGCRCELCSEAQREYKRNFRARQRAEKEAAEMPEDEQQGQFETSEGTGFGTPRPKKQAAPKRAAAKKIAPSISVAEQIALLYKLGGQVAGSRGLPATGGKMVQGAPGYGQAWDAFLRQFPAVYEMLEKGAIAGPVVTLLWMHVELLQTARAEIAQRNAYLQAQGGDLGNAA